MSEIRVWRLVGGPWADKLLPVVAGVSRVDMQRCGPLGLRPQPGTPADRPEIAVGVYERRQDGVDTDLYWSGWSDGEGEPRVEVPTFAPWGVAIEHITAGDRLEIEIATGRVRRWRA